MGRISGDVIGELTRVLRWGTATGDDDGRLLERFLADRDESAFTALVARHGPMVLGVCRRVLRDEHDVQDAFQATFLVLVRSAGAIRRGERVGPWLHGVAHRVSARVRANSARRFVRERGGAEAESLAVAPADRAIEHAELTTILDAELARLPEPLRAPLILCYLEGLTHEQAAGRLRQPVGTIRSRLSRGRERLRTRLARRGVSADDAAWGALVLTEPVSPSLFEATVRSALDFSVPHQAATALVSTTTATLAKGVLDAMLISKLKLAAASAFGLVLTMGGMSGYALQQMPGQEIAKDAPRAVAPTPVAAPDGSANDRKLVERLTEYLGELEQKKGLTEAQLITLNVQVERIKRDLSVLNSRTEEIKRKLADLQGESPSEAGEAPTVASATDGEGGESSTEPAADATVAHLEAQRRRLEAELGVLNQNLELTRRKPSSDRSKTSANGHGSSEPLATPAGPVEKSKQDAAKSITPSAGRVLDSSRPGAVPPVEPDGRQKAGVSKQPIYLDPNQPIVEISPSGDVVTMFGVRNQAMMGMAMGTGMGMGGMGGMMGSGRGRAYASPQSVRLAEKGDPRLEVAAVSNGMGTALMIRGEKVRRVAIFNRNLGRWDVQELREPVMEAMPVSSNMMTVYALGRRLYTYSMAAGRWSLLELPEGAAPRAVARDDGLSLKYGGRVYLYNLQAGEWADFDLTVTPESFQPEDGTGKKTDATGRTDH